MAGSSSGRRSRDTISKPACSGAVGSSSASGGRKRSRLAPDRHRWGSDALYYEDADNSSDEDVGGADHTVSSARKKQKTSSNQFSKAVQATANAKGSGSARFLFNPLGRVEAPGPALVPENLDEGVVDEDFGCPVVDNWLVDDLGPQNRVSFGEGMVKSKKRVEKRAKSTKTATFDEGTVERDNVTAKSPRPVMVSSSEPDSEEDFEQWRRKRRRADEHGQHPSSEQYGSTMTSHLRPPAHLDPPSHLNPPSSSSQVPPLRVKVQIESHCYRIPCPAKIGNKDTPISWLAAQASNRYFSQRGKRPVLELTTMDGASLFEADPISHVLSQGEEVMGVVKDWVFPPLAERYHIACTVAGVGKLYCSQYRTYLLPGFCAY